MSFGTWLLAVLTNLLILGQEWAFLLIYRSGELFFSLHALDQPQNAAQFTIVVPAWSLSIELAFYAIAPFILRRNVVVIAVVALASNWLRFFRSVWSGYYSAATDCRFFPFELSLFLFGSLSYFLYEQLKNRSLTRPALSACLTALLVGCRLRCIRAGLTSSPINSSSWWRFCCRRCSIFRSGTNGTAGWASCAIRVTWFIGQFLGLGSPFATATHGLARTNSGLSLYADRCLADCGLCD
jgi:peptidoglycan/LPS O-acetylase OafA/YrhL